MKLVEYSTRRKIMFKPSDSVVCIGYMISSDAVRKAVNNAGTENVEIIPSLSDYESHFKDNHETAKSLMKYDYHLVFGRVTEESIKSFGQLSPQNNDIFEQKAIVNTEAIGFCDLCTGVIFALRDGKVLRGCMFTALPSPLDYIRLRRIMKARATL